VLVVPAAQEETVQVELVVTLVRRSMRRWAVGSMSIVLPEGESAERETMSWAIFFSSKLKHIRKSSHLRCSFAAKSSFCFASHPLQLSRACRLHSKTFAGPHEKDLWNHTGKVYRLERGHVQ
jgi:alkylhydroperoxidase family enzyme